MKFTKLYVLMLSLIGRMSLMAAVFCESNILPVDTRNNVHSYELGSEILLNVATGNGGVKLNGQSLPVPSGETSYPLVCDLGLYSLRQEIVASNTILYSQDVTLVALNQGRLTIPDGVTELEDYAFRGYEQITSVVIPNSVTNISPTAFAGCSNIVDVTMPILDYLEIHAENSPWIIEGERNENVIYRSNIIGHSQSTSIEYLIPTDMRTLAFSWKVSSESNCDKLIWYLDGKQQGVISGSAEWKDVTKGLDGAAHILRFTYSKDGSVSTGTDCGWVAVSGVYANESSRFYKIFPDLYTRIRSVLLTDGMIIPHNYFQGCSSLESVSIPASVTNISPTAFAGCTAIKSVDFAATNLWREGESSLNLATLFPDAYTNIEQVVVEEGVTRLPDGFIDGCVALEELRLPASLEDLGDNDFRWLGEKLGKNGFWIENGLLLGYFGTAPNEVEIPDGVKVIAGSAFKEQQEIEFIQFPESLRTIGVSAFEGCVDLEDLVLPEGLTWIDDRAFKNCTWIQSIDFPTTLTRMGQSAFENCTSVYPGLVLNEGLKSIGESAFSNCWRMVSVTIPASVDTIGDGAFYDCRNLTGATIPTHVRPVAELFPSAYQKMTDIFIAEGETQMVAGIFAQCTALSQMCIPETILAVSDAAFQNCSALKDVTFMGDIYSIGADAFVGCPRLQLPRLPETVQTIGDRAFKGLSQFTNFKFPVNLLSIGSEAFSGCSGLKAVNLPMGLQTLGEKAFYGVSKLTAVDIPATVTSLGVSAFGGCGSIRVVSLPGGLRATSAVFPNSYQIISSATVTAGTPELCDDLFKDCVKLAQVDLPSSVTNIGANAFLNCSVLTTVGIPNGVQALGRSSFSGCSSLTSLALPQGLTSLADETFYNCRSLGELVIPDSVTSLGARIISNCSSITNILYVGNAPSYAEAAYQGAPQNMSSRVVLGTTGWDGVMGSKAIPETWPTSYARPISYWDVIRFDVSFYGNGGAPENQSIKQVTGLTYTLPSENPTRIGHTFAGWWTEPENGAQIKATSKVTGTRPHNLYAHWTPNAYTVAFHPNGGVGTMESLSLVYDKSITLSPCSYYKKNADFAGWATERGGSIVYADGADVKNLTMVSGELITLYAVWVDRDWVAADYLSCPNRSFVDSGDAPWVPDEEIYVSAPGAMRSGAIEAAAEYGQTASVLSTTVWGEGTGSFQWKVDCEPAEGSDYYDYALFEIDGVEVAKIAGHVNWSVVQFAVTGAGEHTLRWTFSRDDYDEDPFAYENAAWLDDFVFTPKMVSVSFDANGATSGEAPAPLKGAAGETITLPDAGTLKCVAMQFEGWYDTDADVTYRGGTAYVLGITNVTLKAVWRERVWTINEILGAMNMIFTTDEGDDAWFADFANIHKGEASLRSGTIADSQASSLRAAFSGKGELSFWTRTDGEVSRGKMSDYLKVELDGEIIFTGATNDWTNVVVAVTNAGEHTVIWTYLKNGSKSVGLDRAWLSEVAWTEEVEPVPADEGTALTSISATGTQYVDTGIVMAEGFVAELDCEAVKPTSDKTYLLAAYDDDHEAYAVGVDSSGAYLCGVGAKQRFTGGVATKRTTVRFALGPDNTYTFATGGVVIATTTCTKTPTAKYSQYLFARNEKGTASKFATATLYSAKIYTNTTVLARDYVPWRSAAGEVGLFDRVTKTFVTAAGTGSFTAGLPVGDSEAGPTIGDEPISYGEEFTRASTVNPIVYPVAPTLEAEGAGVKIVVTDATGRHETRVPAYYTPRIEGTTVYLALNENAAPTIGTDAGDAEDGFVVTGETVQIRFKENAAAAGRLYYAIAIASEVTGEYEVPAGTSYQQATTLSVSREAESVKGFYKIFVSDHP